jgi:hypothetical protein
MAGGEIDSEKVQSVSVADPFRDRKRQNHTSDFEIARQWKRISFSFARDYGLQTEEPRQGRNAATVFRFALL